MKQSTDNNKDRTTNSQRDTGVVSEKSKSLSADDTLSEKDEDERVHEINDVPVNTNEEQDYDEVVHQMPEGRDSTDDEDLDDKVHRQNNSDEDSR